MKAQAVTTSKWEREENDDLVKARKALMGAMASKWEEAEDSLDGEPLERDDGASELDLKAAEERRQILRLHFGMQTLENRFLKHFSHFNIRILYLNPLILLQRY